jgi:hypothetical protein
MPDLWMPGAEHQPEGNGGSMVGGPPRAVHHITWDSLGPGGKQPGFDNIAAYLKNVDYCPHLMWDPWTGRVVQFYPANQSARALAHPAGTAETNRMGDVCIQIEIFFSPGAVRDGKAYATVADTPCNGLPQIMAWLRSWGVPDVWPSGWPAWAGNSRSSSNWAGKAGHFGHCHVPANDHTDPGPMPRTMFQEADVPLTTDDIKKIWTSDGIIAAPDGSTTNPQWTAASHLTDLGKQTRLILAALKQLPAADVDEAAIVQGVLAGLAPATLAEHIAQALGPVVAGQVLDALKARLDA